MMKPQTQLIMAALFASVISIAAVETTMAQDPARVDAKHYKVEFENDHVRILRVKYGPKEKSVMHQHPAGVAVSLTEMKGNFALPGGKVEERRFKVGEVRWTDAESHLPESLSDKPFEVILIELKGGKTTGKTTPSVTEDPAKVDSKHYKVEFENDQVRVLRVKLGPQEKTQMHVHPANIAIFLTDGHARFTLPDGKKQEATLKAGQFLWAGQERHAGENLGGPFEAIVVELKAG